MTLKLALLGFWSLWFAIVTATNVLGGLKALHVLGESWRFASTNYEAVVKATARYSPPAWLPAALFAAVIAWQLVTCALLAGAFVSSVAAQAIDLDAATLALGSGVALWAAFMLADEITVKYEFERTHELLFTAQLATLLALQLLPD
jgi:hypothetical protein